MQFALNYEKLKMIFAALAAVSLSAAVFPAETEACSRIVYHGTDSLYIVGRSLDWKTPIPTNVYVYPSGMSKKATCSLMPCAGHRVMVLCMPWGMTVA